MPDLFDTLEKETGVALSCLKQKEMIANPKNFHAILVKEDQTSTSGEKININGEIINTEENLKLLGVNTTNLILVLIFPIFAKKLQYS